MERGIGLWWKRWKLWVVSGVVIAGASLTGAALVAALVTGESRWYNRQPALCAGCHRAKPEWSSWKASPHAAVACTGCHQSPGHQASGVWPLAWAPSYQHRHGSRPGGARGSDGWNGACLTCHSTVRLSSTQADLRIPHQTYMTNAQPDCLHCHASVAHPAAASKENSSAKSTFTMAECVSCHQQKEVRTDCQACHLEKVRPLSHRQPGWDLAHAEGGPDTAQPCLQCHRLINGQSGLAYTGVGAIRATRSCQECHRRKPPGHDPAWQLGHRQAALADRRSCDVCHGGVPGAGRQTGSVACESCHRDRHGAGWERSHPVAIQSRGQAACFACHGTQSCTACHAQKGISS